MTNLGIILSISLVVLLIRASGFLLGNLTISPFWAKALRYLPLGAFTAIIIPIMLKPSDTWQFSWLAAIFAVVAMKIWAKTWVGLLIGLVSYWLLLFLV
jgi:branched-subunit amino acid transport protein